MASFCEKFHVSPEYYKHKMTIPQIALMSLDAPRVIYPKNKSKAGESGSNTSPTGGVKKKVRSAEDVIGLINAKR